MKIESIEVRDFRGFPGRYQFNLGKGGHNLLIYGENGSGKSSLFQALKRFFEADGETHIRDQRNEFVASPEPVVKLDIADYDGEGNRTADSGVFEWSNDANPSAEVLIRQANKTKGCLDYRALLEAHYVHRDSERVEVFDLLMRTILTNVVNPVSKKPFGEELADIRADRLKDMRWGGKDVYRRRLRNFNHGLTETLRSLNDQANTLLNGFFGDIELQLVMGNELMLGGAGRAKFLVSPKVYLTAIVCKAQTRVDPHRFLNEARLSALAIALYLATLLITPPSKLRLLVLDDLLIGIDMSNRVAVLNVLQEHFTDWQIILMTHDRVWYETVRMSTQDQRTWWYSEMFAESAHDGVPTPLWRGHEEGWNSNLERAQQHLASHDHRAAGVYARAAFESTLKRFCDKQGIRVQYKSDPAQMTSEMFWTAVQDKRPDLAKAHGARIARSRKVVLNPLSHDHPTTLTHSEVAEAIAAIEELEQALQRKAT